MKTKMKNYKNRKQMLDDYYIDETVETMDDLKAVACNYDTNYSSLNFKTLAVSHGTYGANGAIVSAYICNPDTDTQFIFSIESRSTLLFAFVS